MTGLFFGLASGCDGSDDSAVSAEAAKTSAEVRDDIDLGFTIDGR
jgi:hypothetical protein